MFTEVIKGRIQQNLGGILRLNSNKSHEELLNNIDALLQKLLNSNFLSDPERNVLRWGKNIVSSKTKTKKRAGAAVGYLYLKNVNRLEKLMLALGFLVDSSMPLNLEEAITG